MPPKVLVDLTKLHFPTDALTIGAIRQTDPEGFREVSPRFFKGDGHGDVSSLLWEERLLAANAFAQALGQSLPFPDEAQERDEIIKELATWYQRFGLASGLEHTKQLVRDLEQSAAKQAEILLGFAPRP